VFANGNCKSYADALDIAQLTGADGVMVANGLLENPCLFGGHPSTQKQCVMDWLELKESGEEDMSFDFFHHVLVFMLRYYSKRKLNVAFIVHSSFIYRSSLRKQERNAFNALKDASSVREFLANRYFC
jgi:tRNA-dihydrouridine synthase 4